MSQRALRGRAFTMLELLVVIVIIAILACLLFPVLAGSKRAARGTVDISNMRQLYIAVTLYENDNNDHSPTLLTEVYGYAGSTAVYVSPLDPRKADRKTGDWTPAPCGPRGYLPRSSYQVSYPYLRTMMPDDEFGLHRYSSDLRKNSQVGMIASPWEGEVVSWDRSFIDDEDSASSYGPRMKGPIYRIKMDGSFYNLHQRRMEDCLGGCTEDLFYNLN